MTSNMQGMDTDHARQISGQMDSHASAVSDVCSRLLSRLQGTSWVGNDKTAVTEDIGTHFMPNAQQFCDDMRQQVAYINAKADQQDATSA